MWLERGVWWKQGESVVETGWVGKGGECGGISERSVVEQGVVSEGSVVEQGAVSEGSVVGQGVVGKGCVVEQGVVGKGGSVVGSVRGNRVWSVRGVWWDRV